MSYIIDVQETDDGDCFVQLPDELIEDLGWQEGDVLAWKPKDDGLILWKINSANDYQIEE